MKRWSMVVALAVAWVFAGVAQSALAVEATDTVDVQANIPPVTDLNFIANPAEQSVGQPNAVLFDTYDRTDCGTTGSWDFMYAPKRCANAGANWHAAEIFINSEGTFSAESVTGTVDGKNLSEILNIGFGGFFGTGHNGAVVDNAGKLPDAQFWETATGWSRPIPTGFFSGKAYFLYRLNVAGLQANTYGDVGDITSTLATL